MTIVKQCASFLCVRATPTSPCAFGPPAGKGPYPPATIVGGGASIRIYDSDIFSNCAFTNSAFYFEQIPGELILHDSMGLMEAPGDNPGTLIKINPDIDLSEHGQMAIAATLPGGMVFDIRLNSWVDKLHRTNWSALPPAMLPFQSTTVYLPNPPTAGYWRPGQQVWNTHPTGGGVLGWVCVEEGWPGGWVAIAAGSAVIRPGQDPV